MPNPNANQCAGQHRGFEVFWPSEETLQVWRDEAEDANCWHEASQTTAGWYWWPCQPGCLPDGDATGPFETSRDAYNDATDGLVEHAESKAYGRG